MSLRYGKPGAGVAALPPGLAGGAAGGGDAYVGGGIFGSGRPSMPVPIHDDTPYVPQPQLEDPYEQAEMMNKESDTLFGNDQNTGINFDAYDEIPVETSGNDVPAHANRFEDMGLNPALMENIRRCKYTKPTPVQKYAIPIGMAGRDIMACAQTGSGKTAAFVFPILAQLMASGYTPKERMRIAEPAALIMAPTRELTIQIYEETRKFSYQTGIRPVVMYGGAPGSAQLQSMEHGCDIIVATPGRLADFIERVRVTLEQCKFLVLDEADRMLDMGFEPQIRRIVEGEDMPPTGHRQTMLFSATFPKEIQRLAADFLYNYIFVTVGRVGSSTDLIMQHIEYIQGGLPAKRDMLLQALTAVQGLTLVFVRTKSEADSLVDFLLGRGIQATTIHGDKSQGAREQALRDFRSAHKRVLVATDVAARGLDIPHVTHVINYDMPDDIDDYVHRIGRTGRAGKKGLATAFFDDNAAGLAGALVEVMHETGQAVPDWLNEYAGSGYISSAPPRGGRGFGGRDFREEHGGAGAYSHERLGRHGGGGGGGGGADAFAGNGADAGADAGAGGFGGGDGGFGAVNDDSGW